MPALKKSGEVRRVCALKSWGAIKDGIGSIADINSFARPRSGEGM